MSKANTYAFMAFAMAIIVMVFMVSAKRAEAAPQLQIGCGVAKIATADPIVRGPISETHKHVFFGNKSVSHSSTYKSLYNYKATTCNKKYDTSAYWVPVVRHGSDVLRATKATVYYVGTGDRSELRPPPRGIKMIGTRVDFRCGFESPQTTPPYGCSEQKIRIRVHFPNCWNGNSRHQNSTTYSTGLTCPSNYPYRLPSTRIAIHYDNQGVLQSPLKISAGSGEWKDYTSMHGDIFNAAQQPNFDSAIQQCVIKATRTDICGGRQ